MTKRKPRPSPEERSRPTDWLDNLSVAADYHPNRCEQCEGMGWEPVYMSGYHGKKEGLITCSGCGGTGVGQ